MDMVNDQRHSERALEQEMGMELSGAQVQMSYVLVNRKEKIWRSRIARTYFVLHLNHRLLDNQLRTLHPPHPSSPVPSLLIYLMSPLTPLKVIETIA